MAGLKEIRRRITSVRNTRQITRAMKLVSAAKLRKAQAAATSGRDYISRLGSVLGQVVEALPEEFISPLARATNPDAPRMTLIIAGDKGLCGAYNSNVGKFVQTSKLVTVHSILIGRKAIALGRLYKWNSWKTYEGLSENAIDWPIEELATLVTTELAEGRVSAVDVVYTKFVTALRQEPAVEQLLPIVISQTE